jgi:Activator of Hsp90 ATPase homolog 1-like protein
MSSQAAYAPGPASRAEVEKNGDKWTLILVRELRHAPELVWEALTDPAQLREWAPFEADGNLASPGATVHLTWVGSGRVSETRVTRADPPRVLEYQDIRWQLEPLGSGTRLRLWHSIDRRFVSWGAAGWHICFDVLDRLLAGAPIGRLAGANAMQLASWKRLTAEYAQQFGAATPNVPPQADQKS